MKTHSNSWILFVGAAALLAAVYSFLVWSAPPRHISPDETANGFFASLLTQEGRLWRTEPLNILAPGLIHPRSVKVVGDDLLPGGFIGLPVIYGLAGKIFGVPAIPWFTPILAALAVLAFGALIGRLFGRRVGILAAGLLAADPVWWYEASRTLMPNTLFVSLLIFGAFFMIVQPIARHRAAGDAVGPAVVDWSLAAVLFGLAIAVRASEVYWLVFASLALLPSIWKKISPRPLIALVIFGTLTLVPFFVMNKAFYGDWLASGYAASLGEDAGVELPAGRGAAMIGPLQPYLFPLGFAPRTAWNNFLAYGLRFFGWWTVPVLLSLLASLFAAFWPTGRAAQRRSSGSGPAFAAAALAVTVWLVLFYGSWSIQDNPDPAAVTIGTSYLRYWLPIFVLSVVPVAWAADRLLSLLKGAWASAAGTLALLALAAVSFSSVFGAPQEGLLAIRGNLKRYDVEISRVMELTEPNALVVVDRADKLIFPGRSVMYPLRSPETYAMLPRLAAAVPVYYYGITLPPEDLDYLRRSKLPPLGLTIDPVASFEQETLYAFRMPPRP